MAEEHLDANLGISRRTLIKRGAIVGGAVWAAPAITSFGSRAIGQTATPVGNDISFVALYLQCGTDFYRIKWDVNGSLSTPECGPDFAVDACADQLHKDDPTIEEGCPPGVSATFNATTGSVTVDLGSCTLLDYVVKCGVPADPDDNGCIDPGEQSGQPTVPATGSVTFIECQFEE